MPVYKKITQAVILCAGLGTRLRPFTDTCPKPMVPICGTPLLERTVFSLRRQGYADFLMNLHYFPEQITAHFGDGSRFAISVRYSDETEFLMNTGGALRKMAHMLDDNFLFMYGDELHQFDFSKAVAFHAERGALATIILTRALPPQEGDVARIGADSRVAEWIARPHDITNFSNDYYLNGGLYVLSKRILNYIPAGAALNLDKDIIPAAIAAGEAVFGLPSMQDILDIGSPEKYRCAEEWFMKWGGV